MDELRILQELSGILCNSHNVDVIDVSPDARLKKDLDLDSLEIVELSMEVEKQFDIVLTEDEIDSFTTIQDIITTIAEKLDQK